MSQSRAVSPGRSERSLRQRAEIVNVTKTCTQALIVEGDVFKLGLLVIHMSHLSHYQ